MRSRKAILVTEEQKQRARGERPPAGTSKRAAANAATPGTSTAKPGKSARIRRYIMSNAGAP